MRITFGESPPRTHNVKNLLWSLATKPMSSAHLYQTPSSREPVKAMTTSLSSSGVHSSKLRPMWRTASIIIMYNEYRIRNTDGTLSLSSVVMDKFDGNYPTEANTPAGFSATEIERDCACVTAW